MSGLLELTEKRKPKRLVTGLAPEVRPGDLLRSQLQLADALQHRHDSKRAAAVYLNVAALFAEREQTREALAIAYRALQLDAAQLVLTTLRPLAPALSTELVPLVLRAIDSHQAARRHSDVIDLLSLLVDIDPSDTVSRRRLAEQLLGVGRVSEGLRHLRHAAARYARHGDNAEHLVVLRRIVAVDPNHRWALRCLSQVHLQLGETEQSLGFVTRLLALQEDDGVGLEILARCLANLERTWISACVLGRRVSSLLSARRPAEADALLARARRWRPDDEPFQRALDGLRHTSTANVAANGLRDASRLFGATGPDLTWQPCADHDAEHETLEVGPGPWTRPRRER